MHYLKAILLLLMLPSLTWAQTAVLGTAANPAQPVTVLLNSAIPFIKAPSGTMGNNGAVSAMTALVRTYSNGAYLYLPANAISAGSAAGWYWFVGSSTTAGTVYNSTYTSGVPQRGTTTAFATTGPGAFTGDTGTLTAISITVPARLMGNNGRIDIDTVTLRNTTGGNKVLWVRWGGTSCIGSTYTSPASVVSKCTVTNRGVTNVQALSYWNITSASVVGQGATATDATIDSTADQAVAIQLNSAVATDWAAIDSAIVTVTR